MVLVIKQVNKIFNPTNFWDLIFFTCNIKFKYFYDFISEIFSTGKFIMYTLLGFTPMKLPL